MSQERKDDLVLQSSKQNCGGAAAQRGCAVGQHRSRLGPCIQGELSPAPSEFLVGCLQVTGSSKWLLCVSGRWPLGRVRARIPARAHTPHPEISARPTEHTKPEGTPPVSCPPYYRGACAMAKLPGLHATTCPKGGLRDDFFILLAMQQADWFYEVSPPGLGNPGVPHQHALPDRRCPPKARTPRHTETFAHPHQPYCKTLLMD